MTIALTVSACAEEQAVLDALDLQQLQTYAAEQDFDVIGLTRSIISGEANLWDGLGSLLTQCKAAISADLQSVLAAVLLPSAALLTLKLFLPGGTSTHRTAAFVCRAVCIGSLATAFGQMRSAADGLLQEIGCVSDVLTPAMIAAVALSGAETTASFLSPLGAFCADMIQGLLSQWGIAVSAAAAGTAIAGNLSANVRMKRLHRLLRQFLHWGAGGLLAAFTAILSIQGRLGAGRDSAATRTARYAIENLIPVIGGNVSDSLDSLLSTANVVKNALGASGLALIVSVCLVPMARLLAMSLLLRLSAVVMEPLGDDGMTNLAGQFADSVEMLLIVTVAAAVLCGLLVGSCMSAAANVVR